MKTLLLTLSIISGIMAVIIIVENIFVLVVMYRKPSQLDIINYLILQLAVADLAAGVQFLWFHCIDMFLHLTKSGMAALALCGFWMITIAASIAGLINFARFRLETIRSSKKLTQFSFSRKRAIINMILSWLLPTIVFFIPPMAGWNCISPNSTFPCSTAIPPFTKAYGFLMSLSLMLSILILSVMYLWLYKVVKERNQQVMNGLHHSTNAVHTKLIQSIAVLLALFILTHISVAIILAIDFFVDDPYFNLKEAFMIAATMSFINSLLTPWVYYARLQAFKKEALKILGIYREQQRSLGTLTTYSKNSASA